MLGKKIDWTKKLSLIRKWAPDDTITIEEMARRLNVSVPVLSKKMREMKIKTRNPGKRVWTEAMLNEVRVRFAEGMSDKQIAAAINQLSPPPRHTITTAAVMIRRHQLGLHRTKKVAAAKEDVDDKPTPLQGNRRISLGPPPPWLSG